MPIVFEDKVAAGISGGRFYAYPIVEQIHSRFRAGGSDDVLFHILQGDGEAEKIGPCLSILIPTGEMVFHAIGVYIKRIGGSTRICRSWNRSSKNNLVIGKKVSSCICGAPIHPNGAPNDSITRLCPSRCGTCIRSLRTLVIDGKIHSSKDLSCRAAGRNPSPDAFWQDGSHNL